MPKNLNYIDRMVRYIVGVALLAWAIAGAPWWAFIGLYPLATAAWGVCPIYHLLRPSQE